MSGAPTTFQCRHDVCTYRKRVWKDRRSRNVHEASARYHRCPPGCYRCDTKDAASPKELGQALCPHDGCNRLYNRRHMRAHMANEKLHRLQCSASCEECAKQGWECMGAPGSQTYHVPLPSPTSQPQDVRRHTLERDTLKLDAGRPAPQAASSQTPQPGQMQESMYMQAQINSFDRAAVDRFPMPVESHSSNRYQAANGLEAARLESILAGSRRSLFDKTSLTPAEQAEVRRRREEAALLLSRVTGCPEPSTNITFLMASLPPGELYKTGAPSANLVNVPSPTVAPGSASNGATVPPAAASASSSDAREPQSLMQGLEGILPPARDQRTAPPAPDEQ